MSDAAVVLLREVVAANLTSTDPGNNKVCAACMNILPKDDVWQIVNLGHRYGKQCNPSCLILKIKAFLATLE